MDRRSIGSFHWPAVAHAFRSIVRLCARYVNTWTRNTTDRQLENRVKQRPQPDLWKHGQVLLLSAFVLGSQSAAMAVLGSGSTFEVSVRIKLSQARSNPLPASYGDIVVWLVPAPALRARSPDAQHPSYCIAQHNKLFEPRLLVVPVGSTVEFCNRDPWVHEPFAFSNDHLLHLIPGRSDGRKMLQFDRAGVTYLFCAIHPQMNAVILAVDSPHFGVANKWGRLTVRNVPAGTYAVHVWYGHAATKVSRHLVVLPGQNCRPTLSIALAKRTNATDQTDSQRSYIGGTP